MTPSPQPASQPRPDEVLVAFLERLLADQSAGRTHPLADYLRIWPDHEVAIAREFLAATQATTAGAGVDDQGGMGETASIGPYRIDKEIGRGGQAIVYLAIDTRLHRQVALKVLLRLGTAAGSQLQRFRREAEVASRLDLPGICGIHDAGIADGIPYIAMPFLEGETLAARIARSRRERDQRLANGSRHTTLVAGESGDLLVLFERVARILHAAHTAGVLHRDIKPGNIMITPGGEPVIFDFGLAALADPDDGSSLTQSGDVFGTPSYMSPEQITAGRVRLDRRTDVYSLGVSLYESLTLKQPFEGATRAALFHAIVNQTPVHARHVDRSIPSDLCVVLATAMEKDRQRRYQSAADFADDLQAVREHRPIKARRTGPIGHLLRWSRREPAKAGLLSVLLVSLPTIAALVTARIKDRPRVEAAERAIEEDRRHSLLADATDELSEGDPKLAARMFGLAMAVPGAAGDAVGGLVLARLRLHDAAGAIRLLDEHREALGDGAAAFDLREEALRAQGCFAEADRLEREAPAPATALDHQLLAMKALRHCAANDAAHFQLAFAHATSAILLSSKPCLLHYDLRLHAAGHCLRRDAVLETVAATAKRWPGSARAQFRCGWALKMLEDPALLDTAIGHLRLAIELRAEHAGAYNILGNCLSDKGRFDEAAAAFEASLRLRPGDSQIHVNFAILLARAGQFDRAVERCRQALALDADQGMAYAVLGNCHDSKHEPEPAIDSYRTALRLLPNEPSVCRNLARLLADRGLACDQSGRSDEAIAAYRESLQLRPTAATHNNLGKTLLDKGLPGEAEVELLAAVALDPSFVDVHCNLVLSLGAQDKWDDAVTAAAQAVRAAPQCAKAHGLLGNVLIQRQRFEEAVGPCGTAVALDASLEEAACDLGLALAKCGDLERAIATWQRVAVDHPEFGWLWHHLGLALRDAERLEDALDALCRANDVATAEQRASLGLPAQINEVEIRLEVRQRIRAEISGRDASARDPDGADQLVMHAIVALDTGQPELAARWYAKAFESPEHGPVGAGLLHWRSAIVAALRAAQACATRPDAPEQAVAWRSRARTWLRAGLQTVRDRLATGAFTSVDVRRALLPLMTSVDIGAECEAASTARSATEHEEWRTLWRELTDLVPPLRQVRGN